MAHGVRSGVSLHRRQRGNLRCRRIHGIIGLRRCALLVLQRLEMTIDGRRAALAVTAMLLISCARSQHPCDASARSNSQTVAELCDIREYIMQWPGVRNVGIGLYSNQTESQTGLSLQITITATSE